MAINKQSALVTKDLLEIAILVFLIHSRSGLLPETLDVELVVAVVSQEHLHLAGLLVLSREGLPAENARVFRDGRVKLLFCLLGGLASSLCLFANISRLLVAPGNLFFLAAALVEHVPSKTREERVHIQFVLVCFEHGLSALLRVLFKQQEFVEQRAILVHKVFALCVLLNLFLGLE